MDQPSSAEEGWGNVDGVVVLGAHGGAGTTTLTRLLPDPAYDLGPVMEPSGSARQVHAAGLPVVLVTRNTVPSAASASTAVAELGKQGLRPTCLVIVSDGAGPEPREAKVLFRMLEPHVGSASGGALVRFSFIPSLRGSEEVPTAEELPRRSVVELTRIKELILQKDTES